jgi:hypothetical protein
MRSVIYDRSDVLMLDRYCWDPTLSRFTGIIYSEYHSGGARRQLFFEDSIAARLYARGRGYRVLLREEDRPQPTIVEDMLLSASSIAGMEEVEYNDYVEAYGVSLIDVGMA